MEPLMTVLQEGAARVFTEPVTAGDHVTITATACAGAGHLRIRRRRVVALIEVGPDGLRVKPVVDVARVGVAIVAAVLAVWTVRAR
jgi:hypothetical protein